LCLVLMGNCGLYFYQVEIFVISGMESCGRSCYHEGQGIPKDFVVDVMSLMEVRRFYVRDNVRKLCINVCLRKKLKILR